jgi:hypothetical protein
MIPVAYEERGATKIGIAVMGGSHLLSYWETYRDRVANI